MNNFYSTLALVAITTQALQLDYDDTSRLVQLLPNATGTSGSSLAQVDAGGEVGLSSVTDDVESRVAAVQLTINDQTETLANQ